MHADIMTRILCTMKNDGNTYGMSGTDGSTHFEEMVRL